MSIRSEEDRVFDELRKKSRTVVSDGVVYEEDFLCARYENLVPVTLKKV